MILRPKGAGKTTICPAAFVFETPTGIAWVEPSYADPYGSSSPAYHARDGVPAGITEAGFVMPGENALAVVPYDRAEFDLVGDALDWFANWLKSEGRTWQEERERVRERVQRNWQ
ncbi:MAG: hypothetical protein KA439_09745 [Rhizobacter sp.]|nr:hypothetical protein [Rhizobacter sp.]